MKNVIKSVISIATILTVLFFNISFNFDVLFHPYEQNGHFVQVGPIKAYASTEYCIYDKYNAGFIYKEEITVYTSSNLYEVLYDCGDEYDIQYGDVYYKAYENYVQNGDRYRATGSVISRNKGNSLTGGYTYGITSSPMADSQPTTLFKPSGSAISTYFRMNGLGFYNYYAYYEGTRTRLVRGPEGPTTLVQAGIVAPLGSYPNDGKYTDGYWYKKVTTIPTLSANLPSPNGTIGAPFVPSISVSDIDGDVLTCKYYLDSSTTPAETKQISNTATAQIVNFNMLDIGSLSGVSHSITFEVSDGKAPPVTQTVAFSIDKVPPEINPITVTSADTSITVTGSAKSTVTDLNDLPYRYTVNGVQSTWRTDTTYTAGSLTPNTKYTVKFEARDKLGNTVSDQKDVYTKAQKPSASLTSSTETTLDLKITDSNPAGTQYLITVGSKYVNSSGSLVDEPQWFAPVNKTITIKGLQQNTGYVVGVKAKNAEGAETDTSQASRTTLAVPPMISFKEIKQTSIKLEWNAVAGATYILEVDGVNKGAVTGTEYTHINLSPGTEHKYRIKAENAGGEGNWSSYYNASTLPYPPTALTTISAIETQTDITLSWDKIAKATSYEVEIDGSTTPVKVGNVLTYTHSGLTPENEHKYRVRAVNAGGASDWSPDITVTTLPVPPPVPEGIDVSKTNTSITLKWKPSDRATSYLVKVDGQVIDNKAETTYIHKGLSPLSRHTYSIKALNRGGGNGWSKELIVITNPDKPETPSNIIATSDLSSISFTWYEVPYAESYDIEIDGSTVASTIGKGASYVHTGLKPDSQHTYRIKAVNVTGESEWSKPITISTLPEPASGNDGEEPADASLTNVIAIVTNNTITLSWDAVTHDGAYEIEVDGKLCDNGKNTSFSHTGLTAETYHMYRIRVKDSEGTAEWCAVLTLSTMPDIPDAPKGLKAFAANNSIEIRWDKVTGATGYDVEADGTVVDAGELESYIQKPLEPGTTHTYRVRAKNISGVTAWSEVISPSTTNPTYMVECKKGEEFSLSLVASDVWDFTGLRFVVTYDSNELGIADMCGFTPAKDVISEGTVPGTKLKVKSETGRAEFSLDESVAPGTVWSGEVTEIVFKPNVTGKVELNFYTTTD